MKTNVLILLGLTSILALFYFGTTLTRTDAKEIVADCDSQPDRAKCYEQEIPALYPERPLTEIFSLIREVRALDSTYQFCHVLAHKLGENAVAEDPARWLELIPLNPPDGICSNGFIHGVIVGRFRDDVLDSAAMEAAIPDFAQACEPRIDWSPSPLDQAICYHGMGHLFMFVTNADIRRSLDACARISKSPTGDFSRVCREGVFMQIYQAIEPDDLALIDLLPEKYTKESYRRLCSVYTDPGEVGACTREAWPMFLSEFLEGRGVTDFCSTQPTIDETHTCYQSISSVIGRQLLHNPPKAIAACSSIPDQYSLLCYVSVAQAFLEEDRADGDRALAICAGAPEALQSYCRKEIASRARFIFAPDSIEKKRFCDLIENKYDLSCD